MSRNTVSFTQVGWVKIYRLQAIVRLRNTLLRPRGKVVSADHIAVAVDRGLAGDEDEAAGGDVDDLGIARRCAEFGADWCDVIEGSKPLVMRKSFPSSCPAFVPGIHVFSQFAVCQKRWMVGKPVVTNGYQLFGTAGADVGGVKSGGAFFGFQRPRIERRPKNEEKDQRDGIGLRRRDCPPRKASDISCRTGLVFHRGVVRETDAEGKGEMPPFSRKTDDRRAPEQRRKRRKAERGGDDHDALPMLSINRPKASGAAACAIRAGAPMMPSR